MIMDELNRFSSAQAVTTVPVASTAAVYLGPVGPHGYSTGSRLMEVLITVDTTVTQSGSGTVTFSVRSSNTATGAGTAASPYVLSGTITTHDVSAAIPKASLAAGAKVPFRPALPVDAGKFVDVYYNASETLTGGAFSAVLVEGRNLPAS